MLQKILHFLYSPFKRPHRIPVDYASLEALKWLALVLMTGDHVAHILLLKTMPDIAWPMIFTGRLVMPIFAFCLAYALAQPTALEKGLYRRVSTRLLITAIIACLPYVALRGWYPLNILFTLLIGASITYLILQGEVYRRTLNADKNYNAFSNPEKLEYQNEIYAALLFIFAGVFCEYGWVGLLVFISAWYYCRKPCLKTLLVCALSIALLFQANGNNFYALLAIPTIYCFGKLNFSVPRIKYIFYAYYPIHLAIIYTYQENAYYINHFFKRLF